MLYKIRFVFFRYIRHWGCKLLFINAVQYIFILLVPIRFVLGVVNCKGRASAHSNKGVGVLHYLLFALYMVPASFHFFTFSLFHLYPGGG